MARQVKTVKLPASSTRSFWLRSFFVPSMESVIAKWTRKGWRLLDTTPITGRRGQTTHYLLTFEKGEDKKKGR